MYEYFPCMCLCTTACLVPVEARGGFRSLGSGVADNCELFCGCWELKLGLLVK